MSTPAQPQLKPRRAYRTRDLAAWGANTPRLAKRLVQEGVLVPLAQWLFVYPKQGRFGKAPASDQELMRAFLDDAPFIFTGPERWNALGLGSTAAYAATLMYNTKRSGVFNLGGRQFSLRRVAFPANPPVEWYVIDLFENAEPAGVARSDLAAALARAVAQRRFGAAPLAEMAKRFGSKSTQAMVLATLRSAPT